MSGTTLTKYEEEFRLSVNIDTSALTTEQLEALKKRYVAGQASIVADSTTRTIKFEAAKSDIESSIQNAVKLEQTSADYSVVTETKGGAATTTVVASSKGDANYGSCLFTLVILLVIGGVIAFLAFGGKKSSRDRHGYSSRPNKTQSSGGSYYGTGGYAPRNSSSRQRYNSQRPYDHR